MLYEHTTLAAVAEIIEDFQASHGHDDLRAFAHALRGRLEQRGKPAARVLQHFAECGCQMRYQTRRTERRLLPCRAYASEHDLAESERGARDVARVHATLIFLESIWQPGP